jgi:EmrB/QacA subfamily drug resistance transporter
VLLVVGLGAFMAFLDMTVVNVAFPHIQASFPGTSRAWLSWILNIYSIVTFALLVPAGQLADLVGRRRLFLLGLAVFTGASALFAIANSPLVLVLLRFVQAVAAAAVIPTMVALLLPEFPPERRVGAIAIVGAGAAVAAGTGPPLAGLLIDLWSWRLVFLVNIPIGVLTYILGRRVLAESRDPRQGRVPDILGVAFLIAGLGTFVLAVVEGNVWGWTSLPTLACAGIGVALVGAVVVRSRSRPAPALELSLLRVPGVLVANFAGVVFAAAVFAKLLLDVLFLSDVWHYPAASVGLALAVGPLITAMFAPLAGRLSTRYGTRAIALCGMALYCGGSVWLLARAGTERAYLEVFLPNSVLTGLGNALAFPTLTSAALQFLPETRYATGSALNAAARQLGAVVGVAVAIAILGSTTTDTDLAHLDSAWTFTALATALAACVALRLASQRAKPRAAADAPAGAHATARAELL